MPIWANRCRGTWTEAKNPPTCATCEYIEECKDLDGSRLQQYCSFYWDKCVNEALEKSLISENKTEEEKSWDEFLEYITRQNQLERMWRECRPEPRYDWRYYGVNITVPYKPRLEGVVVKKPWYKRLWDALCSWADDGTFFVGDR